MSEEKKSEETREPEETTVTPSLEKKLKIPNQININETKSLGGALSQIKLFDENLKKTLEVIDIASFSSSIESLKKYEELTSVTMKVIDDSVKFNFVDSNVTDYLNELQNMYYDLNQEIADVPNVSILSQKALLNDIATKMEETIRAQNAYIESLEKVLTYRESEIRQLRAAIEEKKKKDTSII
jgi:hypothetical protein